MMKINLQVTRNLSNFAVTNARMAESVDALVSNTNGAIRAGSIPAPGTGGEHLVDAPLFLCAVSVGTRHASNVGTCVRPRGGLRSQRRDTVCRVRKQVVAYQLIAFAALRTRHAVSLLAAPPFAVWEFCPPAMRWRCSGEAVAVAGQPHGDAVHFHVTQHTHYGGYVHAARDMYSIW